MSFICQVIICSWWCINRNMLRNVKNIDIQIPCAQMCTHFHTKLQNLCSFHSLHSSISGCNLITRPQVSERSLPPPPPQQQCLHDRVLAEIKQERKLRPVGQHHTKCKGTVPQTFLLLSLKGKVQLQLLLGRRAETFSGEQPHRKQSWQKKGWWWEGTGIWTCNSEDFQS